MIRLHYLAPALLLSACATAAAQPDNSAEPAVAGAGECRNDGLERFVGEQPTQQLGSEMLRVSGAKTIQWIEHDMMVTMEFRSDRLRVQLGADGRIQSARCG